MLGGIFSSKSGINANYSFSSQPTFMSEPWSIYTGKPKSSSKYNKFEKCSIFVFDKKKFELYMSKNGLTSGSNKQYLTESYDLLRKQVSTLTKLKHPNILQIIEPIEEHSKNFMFVTEYVSGSLNTVYHREENNYSSHSNRDMLNVGDDGDDNVDNNDVIFQRGLLQIVQGLNFIHNTANSVVLDLQPNNIYINENGDWKLGGLMHLQKISNSGGGTDSADVLFNDNGGEYHPRLPGFLHIPFDYTAPEVILDNQLNCKNDYFSLGCIIYFLYYGTSLFNCENSPQYYKQEYSKFEKKLLQLNWDRIFPKITNSKLSMLIPKLMNRDIFARFDNINELFDQEFCKDPLITTLIFLDDFPTKSFEEKKLFLQGLVEYVPKFPKQISQRSILPHLIGVLELGYNVKSDHAELLPIVLEVILIIGSQFSQLTFNEKVYSHMRIQDLIVNNCSIVFYQYLDILQKKIKKEEFTNNLLKPLLTCTLDKNECNIEIQEWCLKNETIILVLDTLDFPTIKNFYFPLISKTFTMTTSLNIKISCARCFHLMIEKNSIDKYQALDEIVPLFAGMKTRDQRILLTSLPVFVKISDLYKEQETVIVEKVLPLLWSFSMADTLTVANYEKFNNVINTISASVQKRHLEILQNKQKNSLTCNSDNNEGGVNNGNETTVFAKMIERTAQEKINDNKKKDYDAEETSNITSVAPMKATPKRTVSPPATTAYNSERKIVVKPLVALNPRSRPRTTNPPQTSSSYNYFKDDATETPAVSKSNNKSYADDKFSAFVQSPLPPPPPQSRSQPQITSSNTLSFGGSSVSSSSNNFNTAPLVPSSNRAPNQANHPPGFSMSLLQPMSKNSNNSPSNSGSLI